MRKRQFISIISAAMLLASAPAFTYAEDAAQEQVLAEEDVAADLEDELEPEEDTEAGTEQSKSGKDAQSKDKDKKKGTDNLDEISDLIEDDDDIETNSIPGDPEMSLEEMWDDQMHNRQFPGFEVDPSRYPAANITENTIALYRFLTEELGLSHAGACGVLANVQLESNFRPIALGDSGTSYGICQWHNGRFTSLMNFCKARGLDYNTLEGQLAYLEYELYHGYRGVYEALLEVDDEDGAYQAAYVFCSRFEMPDQIEARSIRRGNLARTEYYDKDFDVLEWELIHAQLIDGTDWLGLLDLEERLLPAWQSALGEPMLLL